jgi:FMN phosphatase YigB (HAD superfamily)
MRSGLAVLAIAAALASGDVGAACPRAIFFDLGNTLVESGTGGLFVVRPGAQATIDRLQAAGVRLGVITNVPAGWTREDLEALLAEPSFLDEFEVVVLSSQAPAAKPDPQIYLHAHGLLAAAPAVAETAFVGETLSEIANTALNPTSGARAAGMIGIHLSASAPSPLADYTLPINDLPAIYRHVETHCRVHMDGFEGAVRRTEGARTVAVLDSQG